MIWTGETPIDWNSTLPLIWLIPMLPIYFVLSFIANGDKADIIQAALIAFMWPYLLVFYAMPYAILTLLIYVNDLVLRARAKAATSADGAVSE